MTIEKAQDSAAPTGAASALSAGLERMFRVAKTDHPDLVGGIVWADCELRWINERITLAILAEREACAMECDTIMERHSIKAAEARSTKECEFRDAEACGAEDCSEAIRMRSNV